MTSLFWKGGKTVHQSWKRMASVTGACNSHLSSATVNHRWHTAFCVGSRYRELEPLYLLTIYHMFATVTLRKSKVNDLTFRYHCFESFPTLKNELWVTLMLLQYDWWILPPMVLTVKAHTAKFVELQLYFLQFLHLFPDRCFQGQQTAQSLLWLILYLLLNLSLSRLLEGF